MTHRRSLLSLSTIATVVTFGTAACSDPGGHPSAYQSDPTGEQRAEEVVQAAPAEDAGPPPQVCVPRSWRECRIYYRLPSGQLECPTTTQWCRSDGFAWLECGALPDAAGPR